MSQFFTFSYNLQILRGNSNRNDVIRNDFYEELTLDRITFHPVTWYRWICLRVDMIGCIKGNLNMFCKFQIHSVQIYFTTATLKCLIKLASTPSSHPMKGPNIKNFKKSFCFLKRRKMIFETCPVSFRFIVCRYFFFQNGDFKLLKTTTTTTTTTITTTCIHPFFSPSDFDSLPCPLVR